MFCLSGTFWPLLTLFGPEEERKITPNLAVNRIELKPAFGPVFVFSDSFFLCINLVTISI